MNSIFTTEIRLSFMIFETTQFESKGCTLEQKDEHTGTAFPCPVFQFSLKKIMYNTKNLQCSEWSLLNFISYVWYFFCFCRNLFSSYEFFSIFSVFLQILFRLSVDSICHFKRHQRSSQETVRITSIDAISRLVRLERGLVLQVLLLEDLFYLIT